MITDHDRKQKELNIMTEQDDAMDELFATHFSEPIRFLHSKLSREDISEYYRLVDVELGGCLQSAVVELLAKRDTDFDLVARTVTEVLSDLVAAVPRVERARVFANAVVKLSGAHDMPPPDGPGRKLRLVA
jgi:hypothetical protein